MEIFSHRGNLIFKDNDLFVEYEGVEYKISTKSITMAEKLHKEGVKEVDFIDINQFYPPNDQRDAKWCVIYCPYCNNH